MWHERNEAETKRLRDMCKRHGGANMGISEEGYDILRERQERQVNVPEEVKQSAIDVTGVTKPCLSVIVIHDTASGTSNQPPDVETESKGFPTRRERRNTINYYQYY